MEIVRYVSKEDIRDFFGREIGISNLVVRSQRESDINADFGKTIPIKIIIPDIENEKQNPL